MTATQRGIYHNLKESKYAASNGEIVLFFSSKLYLQKFISDYQENRKTYNERINRMIKDEPYNMDTLADMQFYKTIEKRGFRVVFKGVELDCESVRRYELRKMIEKNTTDWYVIQKPKLQEHLKITE